MIERALTCFGILYQFHHTKERKQVNTGKQNMKNNMRLITVQDKDSDREYDLHFIIPQGMKTDEAIRIVDAAVDVAKRNVDYTYDDLENILTPLGFIAPLYITANCKW